jgi:membrane protease YdiL (CAAX protease family)
VRTDLGLRLGPHPLREVGCGLMVYASALPLLLVGGLMTMLLNAARDRMAPGTPMPSHPAQQALMGADWSTIIQIMVLGVLVAPLVEETMFRGALYRQLRDATRWLGFAGSAIISAAISSVIFAAIHPQGWVFVPALASLALAFCIAREWRGNLPAGVVAHGITNFVTLSLNVLLFG